MIMRWGSWVALAVISGSLGACGDSSAPTDGAEESVASSHAAVTKGSAGAQLGDGNYCDDPAHLCGLGEGDCDTTSQCQAPYVCVPGNLAKRGPLVGDACAPSHCGNGQKDVDETSKDCGGSCGSDCTVVCDQPNGTSQKCSSDCPCGVGEGDCSGTSDCQAGLVCGSNNGPLFNLPNGIDACWAATCQNSVKDGNETAIDCGGSCKPCAPPPAGPVAVSSGGAALVPIVIAPHSDNAVHSKVVTIANELRDKLNEIVGSSTFVVAAPSNTPSGISLGIDGDFPGTGWPYQGYFRPSDLGSGGSIQPERLARLEQYVLRTPLGSNRVVVAGATTDALQDATWDMLSRVGYRHYFQTAKWEITPRIPSLSFNLAVDEKPAFFARTVTFNPTYFNNVEQVAHNAEAAAWNKHNRLGGQTALNPSQIYSAVISSWATRHGQAFPPVLTTKNTSTANDNQFCLSTVASVGGQPVRAVDAVREWAQLQTGAYVVSLSPNPRIPWTSSTCPDESDPVYSNLANRIAAIANAAAEAQPNKVISGKLFDDVGDAPTIALRQNVFMVVERLYASYTPFSIENRLSNWSAPAVAGGLIDFLGRSEGERPGASIASTQQMSDRVTSFYRQGARHYNVIMQSGWGLAGPSPWALAQLLWDADAPLTVEQYRSDFFNNAFGPTTSGAARKYFDALEDHPLNSEALIGSMYRALDEAFLASDSAPIDSRSAIQDRLGDLAIYTRYLELYRKFWNRCSAQSPATEQTELKELLQFLYATRDSTMLRSREGMISIMADAGATPCAAGSTCTSAGCENNTTHLLTGAVCVMPAWNVSCPSPAGPTTDCQTCYAPSTTCNETKNGTAPTVAQLRPIVTAGAAYNAVLDPALLRSFSKDLVPYTPEPSTLPSYMPELYTTGPHYLYLQRPVASGPVTLHERKYGPNTVLLGQLSSLLTGQVVGTKLSLAGEPEVDWTFGSNDGGVYRFDVDDQADYLFTSVPTGTRLAIPVGRTDAPLALNYRWKGYFLVPAGTDKVVGWSETDGTFFRTHRVGQAWVTDPAGYLSDYAVGHACTNPRIITDYHLGKTLDDNFVIPISPPAPTNELWLFNDGTSGTIGDRVLLNVPPYLYRSPSEVLVPREVAPETTNPTTCSTSSPCPSGQYCSQAGTCRSDGGSCSVTSQCASGESCQGGLCACTSTTACSSACKCGTGGICSGDSACQAGLSCVGGTCQSCGAIGCSGAGCASSADCAAGLVCQSGQCRVTCASNPTAPDCIESMCTNGAQDGAETGIDCGGDCPTKCATNQGCNSDADCGSGLACGTNNGGCFGGPRRNKVCWPTQCQDGVEPSECGQANSPCGQFCGCAVPWDPAAPTACPPGEVGKAKLGQLFDVSAPGVCVDPSCPSNDPAKCGEEWSLCGKQCVCTPSCAGATAANAGDGCGGECPHLCADGQECCTNDLHCAGGSSCKVQPNGKGICTKDVCMFQHLVPPLCGSPNAPCGAQCPVCTPECDGRECGDDPVCGTSCGSCDSGFACSGTGQCLPTVRTNALPQVPDGSGGVRDLNPLPEAPTSPVGVVAGNFAVSDQGTAQYTIPIQVPPGRAGIEPNLSLQYSASRVNGQAGVGWQLAGLSQITRCPRNFALDAYAAPVNEDVSDHFCIDGKRLETISGSAPYGADGAEYRTLIDTFTKVVSHQEEGDGHQLPAIANVGKILRSLQGPDYFEVWMKDGRIFTYGRTRDSLIQGYNGKRQAWMLNEVRDRVGNRMVISYFNLLAEVPMLKMFDAPNIAVPRAISYTGHGTDKGNREVRFEYESRNDQQLSFLQGSTPVKTVNRLKRVVTYVHSRPVKNYRLDYAGQDLSQVRKIFECEKDSFETCKLPTEFQYEETTGFTQEPPGAIVPGDIESAGQLDVNGDGLPDFLITVATVEGIPSNKVMMAVQIGSDVAVQIASMYLGGVGGIAVSAVWTIIKVPFWGLFADEPKITFTSELMIATGNRASPGRSIENISGLPCQNAPSFFLDYDQDGKSDVVSACTPTDIKLGRANANEQFDNVGTIASLPMAPIRTNLPPPVVYDVNGDGLQDIVNCATPTKLQVRLRSRPSAGFLPPIELSQTGMTMPYCGAYRPTYQIFDVNGDGTPELLTRYSKPQGAHQSASDVGWYILRFVNTDANPNVAEPLQWKRIELPDLGNSPNGEGMMLADLNGDGLQDIWRADTGSSEATAWVNTGGNFLAKSFPYPRPVLDISNQAFRTQATVVDYNGDGRIDILERWQRDRTTASPIPEYDVVLSPAADLSYFTASKLDPPDLLHFNPISGNITPAAFRVVGDLDGDGNQDLFGVADTVMYGKSFHNLLLSKVKDGFGNVVNIQYDFPGTYENACGEGSHWPVTCLPRVNGLVSSHNEGVDNGSGFETIERSYRYTYSNARMDVTGHGWLGFDKRIASESVLDQTRTVTTTFEPVQRYTVGGSPQINPEPPYLYPLAGLPRQIIIDQSYSASSMHREPLEDQSRGLRTIVTNTWIVRQSADHRPFPFRTQSDVDTYSRPTGDVLSPTPFDEDGDRRTDCGESFDTDGYGNLIYHDWACGIPDLTLEYTTVNTLPATPQRASWIISNPELVSTKSFRRDYNHDQTQVVRYEYDSLGQLFTVTRDPDGDAQKTTFIRNGFGNVASTIETVRMGELPRTTSIVYDDDQVFPNKVTNGLGHETQLDFDPGFGSALSLVDPNGIAVQQQYDGLGNLKQVIAPTGTTTYQYEAMPSTLVESEIGMISPRVKVTRETTGAANVSAGRSSQQFDNYGRVVKTTSTGLGGVDVVSERVYDARGRLSVSTLPHVGPALSTVAQQYDYLDRPTVTEYADGAVREVQYASGVALANAPEGWLDDCSVERCAVDVRVEVRAHYPDEEEEPNWEETAQRNVTFTDHAGLVTRTIDGEHFRSGSASTNFLYGAFQRLHSIRDNGNAVTVFDYDPYGRLMTHVDPDVGVSTNTYNGFGELKTSKDPKQHTRTYGYDVLGRLRNIVESNGTTTWNYDDGPSALGRISETISPATVQNPAGQHVLYAYEAATPTRHRGLLESTTHVIDGAAYTVGTKYDSLGRVRMIEYPQAGNGTPIVAKYGYEASSGAMTSVVESGSGVDRPIWHLDSAFQGYLASQTTFGNGAVSSFSYDADRRWLTGVDTTHNGTTVQNLAYTRYSNGQVHEEIGAASSREYSYDAVGRLESLLATANGSTSTRTFTYDAYGNLKKNASLTNSYLSGQVHLLDRVGSNQYHYDDNGNVDSRSGPDVPGQLQTFTYTSFNLPKTVVTGTSTTKLTEFDYTADETRVVRRDAQAATSRHFAGSLYQRLISTTTGSTMEERFSVVAGPGVVAEIVRTAGVDKTLFFHADNLGTPQTITDDSGNVLTQEYDAFGDLVGSPPSINQDPTRIGFTGHQQDNDLRLTDMGGRVYDPLAGRFTTADPMMQAPFSTQGSNRYSYVFNDPINLTDPSGFMSEGGRGLATEAATFYGSPQVFGSVFMLVKDAGAAMGFSGMLGLSLGITGAFNPFGERGGGSYNVRAGTAAARTTSAATPLNALSQMHEPGMAVAIKRNIDDFDARSLLAKLDEGYVNIEVTFEETTGTLHGAPEVKDLGSLPGDELPPREQGGLPPEPRGVPRRHTLEGDGPKPPVEVLDRFVDEPVARGAKKVGSAAGKALWERSKDSLGAQGKALWRGLKRDLSTVNWEKVGIVAIVGGAAGGELYGYCSRRHCSIK
jgi:RHS repeat-associated protein